MAGFVNLSMPPDTAGDCNQTFPAADGATGGETPREIMRRFTGERDMHERQLYSILTLMGAAPFLLAAVAPYLGITSIGPLGPPVGIALSYALAIISFLAGAQWGTYLYHGRELPMNLFLWSNAIVLACWFAFLSGSVVASVVVSIAAFIVLLVIDRRLLDLSIIDRHYFRMRLTATVIACLSLAALLPYR